MNYKINLKDQLIKKTSLLKIILILFLTVSCHNNNNNNNNNNNIEEAENLLNDAKENFNKYGQQDWDKVDTIITSLESDLNKNRENYTLEQIENANKVIGGYKAIMIKKRLNSFKNSMEDIKHQLQGALETISDTTKNK